MKTYKEDLWKYLKKQASEGRPVVLYGTGDGADKIISRLNDNKIPVSGVFASPGFVRNRTFHDMKVTSFEDCLDTFGPGMIVLMCFGSSRPEVMDYARELMEKCEFYAPDVPVYGNKLFDVGFYESNLEAMTRVFNSLADNISKSTYEDIIAARLTGDIRHLMHCEVSQEEADSLLDKAREGTFVDLGAYNGDTVLRYSEMLKGLDGIIAVEPDRRNFRKLKENTEEIASRISTEYVQAFISNEEGEVEVVKNIGRGTSMDKGGDTKVLTVTIDGLLKGKKAGFIKFDVEGAELAAIKGGADTIRTHKPQMNIACYHRSEDLFELPLKVLELNPDYKVYIRHTPSIPAWDTVFYFV